MKGRQLLLILLAMVIYLSGCAQSQTKTSSYKTDVVIIEGYTVSSTGIEFYVQNNLDTDMAEVRVNFFDTSVLGAVLKCDGVRVGGKECVFRNIEAGGVRDVLLELNAPSPVNKETSYPVSFSVSYSFSGTRMVNIPIVDGVSKKTPSLKFYESGPSSGPILLDIQPELEKDVKTQVGSTTKVYWGVVGNTFRVNFKFTHVGTIPNANKVVLPPVKLDFKNLQKGDTCNVLTKTITIPDTPEKNTLVCNFKAIASSPPQPEFYATIQADYSYNYGFTETESFTVYPT